MGSTSLVSTPFFRRGLSRWMIGVAIACVGVSCLLFTFRTQQSTQAAELAEAPQVESDEPLQPIEPLRNLDSGKIALGRKLFSDTRLSHNNQLSCSTCHSLRTGGTDQLARSIGIYGAIGVINAPTVLNSGFNFSQFWDGRADTLEKQVGEPILSKTEMGSSWPEVMTKLQSSAEYVHGFGRVYGDGMQIEHVKNAIAEFERSLSTPNSRFDRYLRHDASALTDQEQHGYKLFKLFGCASCHQGANIGGNMYQKMGVMAPYFEDRGHVTRADLGRFNLTGQPHDRYMFKVPSLRNVALTAPYFHDGSAATLEEAVALMAKYQLGHPLAHPEIEQIVSFLKTLTGELDGQIL